MIFYKLMRKLLLIFFIVLATTRTMAQERAITTGVPFLQIILNCNNISLLFVIK